MKSALEAIRARALERLQNAEDLTALEEARVQLLGKKRRADRHPQDDGPALPGGAPCHGPNGQ